MVFEDSPEARAFYGSNEESRKVSSLATIIIAAFKFLSDNSNIWVILALVSIDWYFFLEMFRFSWFLLRPVTLDFYPRYLEYYLMRFWILFKSSGFVFLWLLIFIKNRPPVLTHSMDCGSNVNLICSLCSAILVHLTCVSPRGQSETRVKCSESALYWFWLDSCVRISGVGWRVNPQI